jgi:phosphohistidine swiveling domain-containing protein
MSPLVVPLDAMPDGGRDLLGGKGSSLARMVSAGVRVPGGFVVTTTTYDAFLKETGALAEIESLLAGADFQELSNLELRCKSIREVVLTAPVPEAAIQEIVAAYAAMGEPFVAVRSSGVAEDLADASFAGLYDSFLHVRGGDAVVDAVRRCWASLWSTRCVSYRHQLGMPLTGSGVAVVVQEMVDATVAGVLFTANPLNGRSDEMVVNAAWGLGEGVASGITTPDEFVLDGKTHRTKRSELGSKQVAVERADDVLGGIVVNDVPEARRSTFCLDDDHLAELARQADHLVELAGGLPQDVEWALRDDQIYILQSRAVTGAGLLFEDGIESWQSAPPSEDSTWTHLWTQQFWTGGVTPLFYSVRARELTASDARLFALYGFPELSSVRRFRYWKGTVLYGCDVERAFYEYVLPRRLRANKLENLPPSWREPASATPFGIERAVRMHARIRLLTGDQGPLRTLAACYAFMDRTEEARGGGEEALRAMTDAELRDAITTQSKMFEDWFTICRPPFHIYGAMAFGLLNELLKTLYEDIGPAFQDLISGIAGETALQREQIEFAELARMVSESPELRARLAEHADGSFFDAVSETADERDFLVAYEHYVAEHGHRGHEDRDIWYPRRFEERAIDVRAFRAVVAAGDPPSPQRNHARQVARREERTQEVLELVAGKPGGFLLAEVLKALLDYVHKLLRFRDDERPFSDLITWSKKQALAELGHRVHARGLLDGEKDFYFLSLPELYEVWEDRHHRELTSAKIAGRRRAFEVVDAKRDRVALFQQGDTPIDEPVVGAREALGEFRGHGTSRGATTGVARTIRNLGAIGRLTKGDILVCQATDPGWAPAFGIISGLVLEAGGMLAHGACLSREYGLPAVTLHGAMAKIPDGSTIRIDGDSGQVAVLS